MKNLDPVQAEQVWMDYVATVKELDAVTIQRATLLAACQIALEKLETTGEYPGIASNLRNAIAKATP